MVDIVICNGSVYAEFESKRLGFVDDVEFYFQPDSSSVEYRTASRMGKSDFDANRNRIRDVRKALQTLVRLDSLFSYSFMFYMVSGTMLS